MSQILGGWFTDKIDLGFLNVEDNLCSPNSNFEIVVSKDTHKSLKSAYVNYEEHGGLMFAEISSDPTGIKLNILNVNEVPNVYETTPNDPKGTRENRYRPDRETYNKLITNNFTNQDPSKILFPIHFHTHPTKDENAHKEYLNACFQLNTSDGDKDAAYSRLIPFGDTYKLRYLNAIITGFDNTLSIVVYAPGVTPMDFWDFRSMKLLNSVVKGGQTVGKEIGSWFKNDENDADALGEAIGTGLSLFFGLRNIRRFDQEGLSLITHHMSNNEYFATLNEHGSTIIKIPQYKKLGV